MTHITSAADSEVLIPGLPNEPGFFTRLHRTRMVEIGTLLSAVATALFGVFYLIGGTPVFFAINLVASCAFVLAGFARPFGVTARLYGAVTIGLLLFGVQLVVVADIGNGITPWLLVPPIAAVIMGERRLTIYAGTIAVAEPTLVVLAVHAGILWPQASLPHPDVLMLSSVFGVLGICAAFAWISNSTRDALQHAVDARNEALATALGTAQAAEEEAIAASEAKDRFFANLTHEIRTPLTGIAGSAELLAETELSGEQRHLADALLASTRGLTALVNAMLDHARLAAGHTNVDLGPMAPRDLARALDSLYRGPAEERGLAFVVAVTDRVPAAIESDRIRLQQVLANLVANAVKFTRDGAVRVGMDWQAQAAGQGTLVASVSDTGPGVAPELREAIFEPFVQGDASIRRSHGGTGLGLAISRQLVELLGGTIELYTELEVGSTFTVRIPAAMADAAATVSSPAARDGAHCSGDQKAGPAGASLEGLRILLVEDNDINRRVATAMLRRSGAEVVGAVDGHEAVGLVGSTPLDLVLMDLQMPGLDGIEATRRIRAREDASGTAHIPIVAMTGNALEDYGDACEAAGMDAFVTKPVTAVQLLAVVARTMTRAGTG